MRRIMVVTLLALFSVACATAETDGQSEASDTTASTLPATTSTTGATTTSTDPCGDGTIDETRALLLEAGCTYVSSEFTIPMVLTPVRDGWVSFGFGDRWFSLDFDDDGDGSSEAALTILLVNEDFEPAAILDDIVNRDRITAESEPTDLTVSGLTATTIDVRLAEDDRFPCGSRISRFLNTGSYISLVNDGPNRTFGLPACRTSRIWAMTVGDTTATMIGAVRNDTEFEDLIPMVEEFLRSSVTFGDSDG